MENKYWNIPSIIFNVIETLLLILGAYFLKLGVVNTLLIFLVFEISRFYFKMPKHYKQWQQCLVWTLIIFLSLFSTLFMLLKIDLLVAIILTVFSGYILTDNANIFDVFMWSGKKTQYQDIIDYIKYNPLNTKIKEFEDKLQDQDNLSYLIYKYRFKDLLTFQQISEKLDIETNRITEIQDKVAFTFRIFIGI